LSFAPYNAGMTQAVGPDFWIPSLSLGKREVVRFLRQRNRIVSALVTPIFFWLFLGAGMGSSFRAGNSDNYMNYFFPGTVVMILLFTAIFSTISIIEDRQEGFLQSVLVAPISPMAIVMGKVIGGTFLAFGQGIIFLALAPLVGFHFHVLGVLLSLVMMLAMSFALTALGFCIAWRMESTQGFHAIMMLFLMPMWLLSGAVFPAANVSFRIVRWAIRANPLSYGLDGLRYAMEWGRAGLVHSFWPCMGITLAFAAVMFMIAAKLATGRIAADLR